MPVLIIEGVQGVGKTAILQELESSELVKNVKFSRTSASNATDYVASNIKKTIDDAKTLMNWADLNKYYAVDRFTASEYVFGQICNRKQDYSWIEHIEREMSTHRILTVYVFAQFGFICSNIWSRRAAYVADLMIANLPEAFQLYSKYLEFSPIPSIAFNNNHTLSLKTNAERLWAEVCDFSCKMWSYERWRFR